MSPERRDVAGANPADSTTTRLSGGKMTNQITAITTPAWTAGIYGQLDAARPVAELLAKSELVPKQFAGKPNDILIAGAMGARLGLDLFSALAGIAVVNGRATLWGDALLAVCQQHAQFGDYQQEVEGDGENMSARVTVTRKGRSPHVETFSVSDAKRAGLWGKQGPWTQHPKRMLALRARAFALRTVFADALAGFHAREEMDDAIDVTDSAVVSRVPEASPAKIREAVAVVVDPPAEQQKAVDPPELSVALLVETARKYHAQFGAKYMDGVREVCAKFGVAKLYETPAEKLNETHIALLDLARSLEAQP